MLLAIVDYIAHFLTSPKAMPIRAKGNRRTAPPAKAKQPIRAGSAITKRIIAIIFVIPQVILKVNFSALKKSHINKSVIAISKIVSSIKISPCKFS